MFLFLNGIFIILNISFFDVYYLLILGAEGYCYT